MTDIEATALAAAVLALDDEHAVRHPSVEQIAERRRAEIATRARAIIADAIGSTFGRQSPNAVARVVAALDDAGLTIMTRRPF